MPVPDLFQAVFAENGNRPLQRQYVQYIQHIPGHDQKTESLRFKLLLQFPQQQITVFGKTLNNDGHITVFVAVIVFIGQPDDPGPGFRTDPG